jgi:cyclopropane-fatty-acyl-phospholipid synthase
LIAAASDRTISGNSRFRRTLHPWLERFHANTAAVQALGFDERCTRMWKFYLAYCEAGFASGYLNVHQLVLER